MLLSGQTTVTTAGTEVVLALHNAQGLPVSIKALAANTGKMYIGRHTDGTVSSSTGFELSAGDTVVLSDVGGMDQILVDSTVNGEKVCWMILAG